MKLSFKTNWYCIFLVLLTLANLYVLAKITFFPYPEQFIYSYLTHKGMLPYKQIFDQHFPGLMFFPVNFYSLGMRNVNVARIWHFSVVGLTHIFLYMLSRKVLKSKKHALTVNFLYFVWQPFYEGYVLWIDSFIPLLLIPACYFLMDITKKVHKRAFLSGALLGVGLVFKQVVLPLIILALIYVYFFAKDSKTFWIFIFGIALPVLIMLLYIFSIGAWEEFYYWTYKFNVTTFAEMGRKLPDFGGLMKSLPIFGFAIVAFVFLLFAKRRDSSWLPIGIFYLSSLMFAFARFDFIHLQPALPFACLILISLLRIIPKRFIYLSVFLLAFSAFYLLLPFYKFHRGGSVPFFGPREMYMKNVIEKYVDEDDPIFAFGTTPHIYQLTNTLPPGRVFVFQFPWFMVEAEDKILEGMLADEPLVVIRDDTASTAGMNLVSYMPKIDEFILDNYKTAEKVDTAEIMIPK